jgi:hypothetical protein
MRIQSSGIIISLTCIITSIVYFIFILLGNSLERTRLYNIIIKNIYGYVPHFSFLVSADIMYSHSSAISPLGTIIINLLNGIFSYPLLMFSAYMYEIIYTAIE